MDFVTGLPLVKVTDLELPFDGATFRLTRTRSGNHPANTSWGSSNFEGADRWWDWLGQGWMAGENPILLIDAAIADVTGDGPRTTWLWLDAHHSIPFQQVYHPAAGATPAHMGYEAPPRFRARMEHNGVWFAPSGPPPQGQMPLEDNQTGHWQTPPTQFDIWLYDGLVHYTFVAVYEDLPPKRWDRRILTGAISGGPPDWAWSSFHDRPFTRNQFWHALNGDLNDWRATGHNPYTLAHNPGFGAPYYGFCVKIQDSNGHSVETSYCDVRRLSIDNPATTCVECTQDYQAKGQIKYIKLRSGTQTKWTLLYAHRRFRGMMEGIAEGYPLHHLKTMFPRLSTPSCIRRLGTPRLIESTSTPGTFRRAR